MGPINLLKEVEYGMSLLERLGGIDARAEMQMRDMVLNHLARQAGGGILLPKIEMMSLNEAFRDLAGATSAEATRLTAQHCKAVKALYRDENGRPPITHKQLVHGQRFDVCDYEVSWLNNHLESLQELVVAARAKR